MKRGHLAAAVLASLSLAASYARAADTSNDDLFQQGVRSLAAGDHDKAIAAFEALADRGVPQPDASYDRGLAYLARVRAKAERPGDLGRAAAAFEETLLARSDDQDAAHAADTVRAEVSRRRARRTGPSEVQARPSLDRLIADLAPESAWAWGALVASAVLTAGLLLRKSTPGPKHLAGIIAVPIGLVLLLTLAPLAGYARMLRQTTRPAIVVAPEAQLLDDKGAALGVDPIPEAARVELHEQRGSLVQIRYGATEAWTHATSVRPLMGPR